MSTGEPLEPTAEQPAATPVHLAYAGASRVETAGSQSRVELFGNLDRPPLYDGVQQMRGYRETRLAVGPDGLAVATADRPRFVEKQIRVPDSWLRGFLQVQSAATLPFDRCRLTPVDLYNLLRHLRMHA